jgi:hypothetical protein
MGFDKIGAPPTDQVYRSPHTLSQRSGIGSSTTGSIKYNNPNVSTTTPILDPLQGTSKNANGERLNLRLSYTLEN